MAFDALGAAGATPPIPEPPEHVGTYTTYELLSLLSEGGMGTVHWARDQFLHRDVAIKILRAEHRFSSELVERFINESRIMSCLQHPGIPAVYDCGYCPDGRPYYAMKLVKGITLGELARRQERSKAGLLSIFSYVCQTLGCAHSQGVVHLDVKPNNIMVGAFGEVHLMDWGLAQWLRSTVTDTGRASLRVGPDASGSIRGTPAYMSPEQARGEALDEQADIFSLGAILCELLTGKPPYGGESAKRVYRSACRCETEAAFQRLDHCSADPRLVRLVKRCLAQQPQDRPATAGEVALELELYQEEILRRVGDDMERFFELSLDLFCIAGFDGYFRRINANFARVLGYRDEEMLSRPFVDFVHDDDREETFLRMSVLSQGEPVVRFRNRYRTVRGNYITFEWTAKSLLGDELIFAVARDVSADIEARGAAPHGAAE